MTGTKRPKLGAVLRGDAPEVRKDSPAPSPPTEQGTVKMVQLNVAVPEELRRRIRIKAMQSGEDVGVIIRRMLQQWVEE